MSRIAVAVLGAVLATTAAAPVTMPARSPAPGTPAARASAAQAPRVPVPAAELPEPTPNCPGLPAASRVSRQPWAQQALGFSEVWPLTRGRGVAVMGSDGMIGAGPGIAEGESGSGSNGATGFVGADDAATEPYGGLPVTGGSGGGRRENERYRHAWMAEDADIWEGEAAPPHRR